MKTLTLLSACLGALLAIGNAQASNTARPELLVEVDWLASRLDDPNLVLLHVGDAEQYAEGHIPGARLVSLDDISSSEHSANGLMREMPNAAELRDRLQSLGISDDSRIVVYYGQDWVSPSTRVVFTLQYAGLGQHSHLLNGGMSAWLRAGHALSQEPAAKTRGSLSPLNIQDLLVDADLVREHASSSGIALVDARAAAFYDGVSIGGAHGQSHRSGHIKGARSIPFTDITDDQLMLRSLAELNTLFHQAGVKPGDTVLGYCHIGQQATLMLFAAQLLGHQVRLYDGSFEDWSRGADNPVSTQAWTAPAGVLQ